MKKRVITGILLAIAVIIILIINNNILLCVAAAAMSAFMVFELLRALNYHKEIFISLISLAYSIILPFMMLDQLMPYLATVFISYIILLFLAIIVSYKRIRLESIGMLFTMNFLIYLGIGLLIRTFTGDNLDGTFTIIVIMMCAFVTDTCAFFTGLALGKHKLAPEISPKKTIEGSIGGFLGCIAIVVCTSLVYEHYFLQDAGHIQFIPLIIITAVGSIAGMIGDLAASMIKRACNIKDFGKLFPGHGGVLDRCDSLIFVAPIMFALINIFPIIIR